MPKKPDNFGDYRENLLKQATPWRRLWRYIRESWGLLLSVISVIIALASILLPKGEYEYWVSTGLLAALALVSVTAFAWTYHRYMRGRTLAFACGPLHAALHMLRDAMNERELSEEDLQTYLREVLSATQSAFNILTNGPCRACIKVVDVIPPQDVQLEDVKEEEVIDYAYARTLSRDVQTTKLLTTTEGRTDYPIKHNTAFWYLFEDPGNRYYLCNNIPKAAANGQYQNTSMSKFDTPSQGKKNTWPLPYRATFVWPIRQIRSKSVDGPGKFTGSQDLIGFLALDTPIQDAFDADIHFDAGALLADALYIFLNQKMPIEDDVTPVENGVEVGDQEC